MFRLIVNPNAGRGKKKKQYRRVLARMRERGLAFSVCETHARGEAKELARQACEAGEDVIVVGGDGTLHEALNGFCNFERCALGLIPLGTGNDFAAAAKIPEDPVRAVDLIADGAPQFTEYMQMPQGVRGINVIGTGIDVEILRRCEGMRYGSRKGRYFRALVASLLSYRGEKVRVTVDGESREYTALIAALCNGTRLGGGIPLCPPARYDDGRLELVVVECPPFAKLLPELVRLMRGKLLTRPITHHIACTEATLTGGGYVQYDGEIVGQETLHAHIVRGGLKMYCGR